MKKRCETLSVEVPQTSMEDACKVAAVSHATISEGIIIITLNSKTLSKAEKKESLTSCTRKASHHGETLKVSVNELIQAKLYEEAMQWLFNN